MNLNNTLPIYWSSDYVLDHGVETRTKSVPLARILASGEVPGTEIRSPLPATRDELLAIHDPKYLDQIINGDADLGRSILASTGGVRDALDAIFISGRAGSLSSGLHHARYYYGQGNCTINGLAIGARLALIAGAKRVLIVDLDAHGGGGTASLIAGVPGIEQIDVSVSSYDAYVGTPQCNYTLVSSASDYLPVVRTALAQCNDPESIDLVIYNAGVDPHQDCTTGGLRGVTTEMLKERENIVFSWAKAHNIPVAFVFAGGYLSSKLDETTLVQLHRNTIEQAANS
jgi:acetoin utilization deacetylase AcuC-like enzyme